MQMENCISPQKYDLSCLHFSPKINVLTWLINKRPKEFINPAGKKKTYSNHNSVGKTF